MLIEPLKARDIQQELFEALTLEGLQDELQLWLDSRTEEVIIALSFEASELDGGPSYRAYVLYTE